MRIGEPIQCTYCHAVLSHIDTPTGNMWKCQFCGTDNALNDVQEGEIPTEPTLDFVLDPPMNRRSQQMSTRLDAVKAAVVQQIQRMKEQTPDQKVCIVQFSSRVEIHGDCTGAPVVVGPKVMNDFDGVVDVAKQHVELQSIEHSYAAIVNKMRDIEENGSTALGPALLISTVIAGKAGVGQVVLCTDGMANSGLGQLEHPDDASKAFYERVAAMAKDTGVVININSLKGCDASLTVLGETAAVTGGEVNIVDPAMIAEVFTDNLNKVVTATDTTVRTFVHPAVYLNDLRSNEQPSRNTVVLGNVYDDTVYQFRYNLRPEAQRAAFGEIATFPVQVQVEYTKPNGMRGMRVLTQVIQVAREDEEVAVNAEVMQDFFIQQTAVLARRGEREEARRQFRNLRSVQTVSTAAYQPMYDGLTLQLQEALTDQHGDQEAMVFQNASNFNFSRAKKYSKK